MPNFTYIKKIKKNKGIDWEEKNSYSSDYDLLIVIIAVIIRVTLDIQNQLAHLKCNILFMKI